MTIMEEKFAGGVAVITGGGSGIGASLARRAAQLGMTVVVADIELDRAEEVSQGIIGAGGRAEAMRVDVSIPEQLDQLAEAVFSRFGSVRLLINNAGVEMLGLCWEVPTARWEATLNVNIHGVVHGVRAFAPRMIAAGQECWIANLSSVGAFGTLATQTAYAMTKHAVQSFTEGLFVDMQLVQAPVHVSAVIPGLMRTSIFNSGEDNDHGNHEDGSENGRRLAAYQRFMAKMAEEQGMDVDQASRLIMEQIAAGKFWVSTEPDLTRKFIAARIQFLEQQENPSMAPGSTHLMDF